LPVFFRTPFCLKEHWVAPVSTQEDDCM